MLLSRSSEFWQAFPKIDNSMESHSRARTEVGVSSVLITAVVPLLQSSA